MSARSELRPKDFKLKLYYVLEFDDNREGLVKGKGGASRSWKMKSGDYE